MAEPTLDQLLKTAEAAADAGAAVLEKEYRRIREGGSLHVKMKESPMDLVTEVDGAAQKVILGVIQKQFPDHRFLAEEEGADALGDPKSPYVWVVDPLDGTTNFIHGKPTFGTIVAVMKGEEILAGCIILPILGHRFTAAKGKGATADGKPVVLRKTANLADAIICSNVTRRGRPDQNGVLHTPIPNCGSMDNYGCAAQVFAEILLGWNDGVLYKGVRMWDIAAGVLMLGEAGGKCRYEWLDTNDRRGGVLCVGSTPPIFDELCDFAFTRKLA